MPLFVYFYKPDHLKERDGVQVGKEVLVWQREGGKHGKNTSEDTLWDEKNSPENVKEDVVDAFSHILWKLKKKENNNILV